MISVSKKMETISVGSQNLDDSLAGKRSKVDKLVRVRRLLQRYYVVYSLYVSYRLFVLNSTD